MRSPRIVLLLATLAAAVYAPVLALPFIANSFIEIPVSRVLGTWQSLPLLLQNANWHFRITYVFLNSWLVSWQGFTPHTFYVATLCLHAGCVVLIYFMGRWRMLSYKGSAWAAAFFAIYSGHHGAVMSLAMWPDLLVTFFAGAAFVCWIRWMQSGQWASYAVSCVFFLFALVSHEAGFLVPLLFALALIVSGKATRHFVISLAPLVVLSTAAVVVQFVMRPQSVAWETSLPVLDRWWIAALWTAAVAGALALLRPVQWSKVAIAMSAWVAAVLATGAYLIYALQINREVAYFASLGTALLFGYMFQELQRRAPFRLLLAAGVFVLVLNTTLLWTIARRQMIALATPTETLLNAAIYARGPIRMTCFPFAMEIAEAVGGSVGAQVTAEKPNEVKRPNCISFSYTDAAGNVRTVFRHSQL
jgi:hypothetical protein